MTFLRQGGYCHIFCSFRHYSLCFDLISDSDIGLFELTRCPSRALNLACSTEIQRHHQVCCSKWAELSGFRCGISVCLRPQAKGPDGRQ